MKRIRVAMIGSRGVPAPPGGVERAVEELAARLASKGVEVTVYSRSGYVPHGIREHRQIQVRRLPAIRTKHLEAISHALLATLDAIVRRYDVVHFHALGPGLCAPLTRLAGLPTVTTVHGLDFRREKWGLVARTVLKMGAWCAARVPTRTTVVSNTLAAHFRDEYRRPTVVIPNGVSLPERATPSREELERRRRDGYLLFLGRLVPDKGVHTLIEAYRALDDAPQLVIAGPPSYAPEYEARLRELAAGDARITFVGPVHGAAKDELIRGAYTLCQPSTVEGLPIVLLEAMAAGLCPVVSDIPEHLEVVRQREGDLVALTFVSGDVEDLRQALRVALENPELLAERGRMAREIVADRYSWDRAAATLHDLLVELVS